MKILVTFFAALRSLLASAPSSPRTIIVGANQVIRAERRGWDVAVLGIDAKEKDWLWMSLDHGYCERYRVVRVDSSTQHAYDDVFEAVVVLDPPSSGGAQ